MAQRKRRKARNRKYRSRGRLTVFFRLLSFLIICSAIVAALILFFKTQTIQVSGNRRYTEQQIIDSSGVAYGENLFLLNKYAITAQITKELPYVEKVRIVRGLPDTLVITVIECEPIAAVVQEERAWLLSPSGKLLENVAARQAAQYPQVTGVQLLLPTEGSSMEFPDEGNAEESHVLGLLTALADREMLADAQSLDCSDPEALIMGYADRFRVVMNYDDDFSQDLEALNLVMEKLQPNETGTILLTNVAEKVNFIPDRS